MPTPALDGLRVAILVAEGFEQVGMTEPRKALEEAGADTRLVSPAGWQVQGWKHFEKADKSDVDVRLEEADPAQFDALVLPGGVANPDQLRVNPHAVKFVRAQQNRRTSITGRGRAARLTPTVGRQE
jgi:protease I